MKTNRRDSSDSQIYRRLGAMRGAAGRYKKILTDNPRLSSDPKHSDLSKLLQRYVSSATRMAVDISLLEDEKDVTTRNVLVSKMLTDMSRMEKVAKQLDALTVNYG